MAATPTSVLTARRCAGCWPSTPSWRPPWPTPTCTPTRTAPAASGSATARWPRSRPSPPSSRTAQDDVEAARELAAEDAAFAAELPELERPRADARAAAARRCCCPRDPLDGKDVILEVKAGEGGEESALFAGDLLRMYLRYAERQGWRTELLDATESDLGGYKDVSVAMKSRALGGEGVWCRLKYEGGVHRVQRVPATESQGRIHTSAAGVLVLPEAEDVEVTIDPNDLRIDVYRSSGPGRAERQHDRLRGPHHAPAHRHRRLLPEREVASCRTRSPRCGSCAPGCWRWPRRQADGGSATRAAARSARSTARERVRTYNFPENRITDHRVGYKAYNLDQVLDGDLDAVIAPRWSRPTCRPGSTARAA